MSWKHLPHNCHFTYRFGDNVVQTIGYTRIKFDLCHYPNHSSLDGLRKTPFRYFLQDFALVLESIPGNEYDMILSAAAIDRHRLLYLGLWEEFLFRITTRIRRYHAKMHRREFRLFEPHINVEDLNTARSERSQTTYRVKPPAVATGISPRTKTVNHANNN
jgi:hypothetical protein